jgi:diguanylate cyclase (GGDEF)-like protein
MGKEHKTHVIMAIVYAVAMLVFIIAVFSHVVPFKLPVSSPDSPAEFGNGWTTQDATTTTADRIYAYANTGKPVVISKQLPDKLYKDSYLNFNAKNVNFTVFVDGQPIYDFTASGPFGLGGMESYFQHIRMDESYAGRTVSMQVVPINDDSSSLFADMSICSINDYNLFFLQRHGLALVLSLLIFFLGVLLIVQYFAIPHEFHAYDTLSLGIASLAVGIWSCVETQIPMLVLGAITPYLLALDYVSLCCAPYPIMMFSSSVLNHRWKQAEYLVLAANIILAGIMCIGCFTDQLDWHAGLPLLYTLLLILFAAIIVSAIRSNILTKRDSSTERTNYMPLAAVGVFIISMVTDLMLYISSNQASVDAASILRIGFVVMQVILLGSFMARGNRDTRTAAQSEAMRKLAYVDALTGIGNRAAFERACDEIDERRHDLDFDFLMACFDVDNLKYVNDTFGHEYGDRHLVAASSALQYSFGGIGELFRVGGDEFDVLIIGKDAEEAYKSAIERLRQVEDGYNEEHPDATLRISSGTCLLSQTANRSLREVAAVADAAMYADKPKRRRKTAS